MAMWFSACLLFENVSPMRSSSENIWEERIVLLDAASDEEALHRAEMIGKHAEHDYIAASGEPIECKFRRIERIFPLDVQQPGDETEVFSRFLRESEVRSLLNPFPDE